MSTTADRLQAIEARFELRCNEISDKLSELAIELQTRHETSAVLSERLQALIPTLVEIKDRQLQMNDRVRQTEIAIGAIRVEFNAVKTWLKIAAFVVGFGTFVGAILVMQ